MVFGQLCAPALIYIVFSITQITMDSLKGLYNIAFVKLFISLLFTILLNHLCQRGLGIISWIIVFIPFMLMSLISALLIVLLGMDVKSGKLNIPEENNEPPKELDVREKAIATYSMNRSREDYEKRLKELGYLNLSIKGGQQLINPAYDEIYNTTKSRQKYELVKSGDSRNKRKTKILAEEIYFLIKKKITNNEIKLEKDLGGKVRNMVIENCDVSIDLIYQDLHYRLSKIYGVYDEEDSKHEDSIKKALKEIKSWGVLRNIEGKTVLSEEMNIKSFREYSDLMTESDPKWIDTVMTNYNEKIKSKFETRCEKIQIKINQYAKENNIDFTDVLKTNGESEYNSLYNDAYTSSISDVRSLWSRTPEDKTDRNIVPVVQKKSNTTNKCNGGSMMQSKPSLPCKKGKCFGVEESCSANKVCLTGCCYNNKCAYYDIDASPPEAEKLGMTNSATSFRAGETAGSEKSMNRAMLRRTGQSAKSEVKDEYINPCPASQPHLRKWSTSDSYWCYQNKNNGANPCKMNNSGFAPPSDGKWGTNQKDCMFGWKDMKKGVPFWSEISRADYLKKTKKGKKEWFKDWMIKNEKGLDTDLFTLSNYGTKKVILGYEYKVKDQGWGGPTKGILILVNKTTGKEHEIHTGEARKKVGGKNEGKVHKGEMDISQFVNHGDKILLRFKPSRGRSGHTLQWDFRKNLHLKFK